MDSAQPITPLRAYTRRLFRRTRLVVGFVVAVLIACLATLSVHSLAVQRQTSPFETALSLTALAACGIVVLVWAWFVLRVARPMEARLRVVDHLSSEAFDQNVLGMGWMAPDGKFIRVNRAFATLVGTTPEELVGRTAAGITYPEDAAADRDYLRRLASGEINFYTREKRYVRPDRSLVWVEITATAVRNGEGNVEFYTAQVQEITQRKQFESRMIEEESRFRAMAERLPIGLFLADRTGRFSYVNPAFELLSGHSQSSALGDGWLRMVHPEDRDGVVRGWTTANRDSSIFAQELRLIKPEKSVVWVSVVASPNVDGDQFRGHVGTCQDITKRRAAELLLKESELRFRAMADSAPVMIWLDDEDQKCIYLNKGWLAFTGRTEEEEANGAWMKGVHPEDLPRLRDTFKRCFDDRQSFRIEYRHRRHDGQYRWLLDMGVPRHDSSGQFAGYIGSCIDIDDSKRAEEQLGAARDAAESASRAKSAFLTNMSHEIRTPMTAILGFTDLLADRSLPEAVRQDHLEMIRDGGRHLLQIINDILDMSKIESGESNLTIARCDVRTICDEVIGLTRPQAAEKKLALVFEWDAGTPAVIGTNALRLRQVLLNLISNAIKFTDAGTVGLSVSPVPASDPPQLQFQVRDTGPGISPENLGRIFTPFYQADTSLTRPAGGTGLGLSISKRLAELLGGQMSVESRPGVGSTFIAVIASLPPTASNVKPRPAVKPFSTRAGVGLRALVVDDSEAIRSLLAQSLARLGVNVIQADDGKKAVELGVDPKLDVIVLDMQMPVMDGYLAARTLRERGVRTRIIAVTAHSMEGDREGCLRAGCDEYMPKPIDMQKLAEMVLGAPIEKSRVDPESVRATFRARYLEELAVEQQSLRSAVSANDARVVHKLLHSIRGAAGVYQFTSIAEGVAVCQQVLNGDLDSVAREKLDQLDQIITAARTGVDRAAANAS